MLIQGLPYRLQVYQLLIQDIQNFEFEVNFL